MIANVTDCYSFYVLWLFVGTGTASILKLVRFITIFGHAPFLNLLELDEMIDFTTDNLPTTSDERIKALASLARVERELGYLDERISEAELPEPNCPGERYEAEVPDTLELTENALYAINAYTRMVDPAMDYRFSGNANFVRTPAVLINGGGLECTAKQTESLMLMRVMTGSMYNASIDNKLMGSMLHLTAADGFFYSPYSKSAWMPDFIGGAPPGQDIVSMTRQPFTSIWEEERQIIALSMWYQQTGNPMWQELIEKKIKRLTELAVWKDDGCYFARRFYVLGDKGPVEGPRPSGQWALFDAMFGVHGMSLYHRLTGHEPALDLAGALVRRVLNDDQAFGEDGRWLTHHFHTNTGALIGMLDYAMTINDRELIAFVGNSYEFGKAIGEPLVGYYAEHTAGNASQHGYELDNEHTTCETCEVADMLVLGVKLTLAGAADYWEDVDRCVRNQFTENQLTRPGWSERFAADSEESPYRALHGPLQLWEQEEDAEERALGSWAGWAYANDAYPQSLMQCCAGNAGRSMYYVWDSIVTEDGDEVQVNLHLNRASKWLDVESHLPYEGKVVLKIKNAPQVKVRIPAWTDCDQVTCDVNGEAIDLDWVKNYIRVKGLSKGDRVTVTFPMREMTLFREIGARSYKLTIKGNTVINIDPPGTIYPLYQREFFRKDKAPLRKVTRFISSDTIKW